MNRKNPIQGYGSNLVIVEAIFKGGGGASNLSVPANSVYAKECNAASTGTIGATGVYTCVMAADSVPPRVFHIIPSVTGDTWNAYVTTQYVAATRTVVITVLDEAGLAADLATTQYLKLLIFGQDSMAG